MTSSPFLINIEKKIKMKLKSKEKFKEIPLY